MSLFRKFLSLFLALLLLSLPVQAGAEEADSQTYVQRMLQYYLRYQDEADQEIDALLDYLVENDPRQGDLWRRIMADWSYINSGMAVREKNLPDGLPEDDSLCIVIMGYGLNPDGTMQQELIDRLKVGLASAKKYPNAYVAVTGGATSNVEGVTEAGQMAQWLRRQGIEKDRLIVEDKALSTVQNARRVHGILMESYPQVTSVAIVTSDYHIHRSCALFSAMNHYSAVENGSRTLQLAGNAVNVTGLRKESLSSQASGICAITGIDYEEIAQTVPELAE